MIETPFDPEALVRELHRCGVDYVLIGGFAAVLHGTNYLTTDLDLCPSRDTTNMAKLSAALTALDAKIRVDGLDEGLPFSHDGSSLLRAQIWNLRSSAGDLDVAFRPSGTDGFDDLVQHAETMDVWGIPVRVASLDDIIRSKRAADRVKDRLVLPGLERIRDERR